MHTYKALICFVSSNDIIMQVNLIYVFNCISVVTVTFTVKYVTYSFVNRYLNSLMYANVLFICIYLSVIAFIVVLLVSHHSYVGCNSVIVCCMPVYILSFYITFSF